MRRGQNAYSSEPHNGVNGLTDALAAQAEDNEGETALSAAAAFTGLREAVVDLVLGKTSIEDMLED